MTSGKGLDGTAMARPVSEIARYLQEQVGPRVAAAVAGLSDAGQIDQYVRGSAMAGAMTERRLREGYEVVRMLVDAYDAETARAWLFGTNNRLDVRAPIDVLGAARRSAEFDAVVEAARGAVGSRA